MNCKPGDLAIVIKSLKGRGVGAIVEVVKAHGDWGGLGFCWVVNSPRPMMTARPDGTNKRLSTLHLAPDDWLRPVSGLPVNDEVTDDIKEPA
ncbi:hypothetical protein [Paraburkholderia caledonica]|uniref:Uncharacterized protein n=1 Tax=Paraburkholderia caledonica TaxID=134536 RepID=A0AB73IRG4_9BURK|nr:hypothetical protein [Paraburkholderia caledonica]